MACSLHEKKRLALLLIVLLAWAACGKSPRDSGDTPAVSVGGLTIRNVAAHLVPGGQYGAVYLQVANDTDSPDRLLSLDSPSVDDIQTHESLEEDGVIRMVSRPDGFEVPAHATLELHQGGKHIMLLGLDDPPAEGGTLRLTLHFEHAGPVEVEARVKAYGE